jgi:hypothetical protein
MPLNPENLYIGEITEDEIKEWTLDENPSRRTDSFSPRISNSQMTYKVPGDKLKAFVSYALGVDYVGADQKLHRIQPMYHPEWTSFWCDAIVSINGVGFRGDYTEMVIYLDQVTPAKWEFFQVVVSFAMPLYPVLGDSEVDAEWKRYTTWKFTSDVQLVSTPNGVVTYDAPGEDWNNQPSLQPVTRREGGGIRMQWMRVPAEFVHDQYKFPSKLLAIQGRVCDDVWFGQEAETVLCKHVDLGDPYVMPITTDTSGQPYFLYDITFEMLWYDPTPKGKAGETRHGWNFAIAPDLKYYYASITGGEKVFTTYDFESAWTYRT